LKQLLSHVVAQTDAQPFVWRVRGKDGGFLRFSGVAKAFPHPQAQRELDIECVARREERADAGATDGPGPEHFGFMLAHELSQPLTSVATSARAGVRLLSQDPANLEELKEALELAAGEAEQAAQTIHGLRQLALRQKPGRSSVELPTLLRECLERCPPPAGYSAEWSFADNLPEIFVDRVQLGLVFLNLVKNAFEAMQDNPPSARRLAIQASHDQSHVHIAVGDAGPGFPLEAAKRGWRPFHSTKRQGMGLGLALCQWIIQAHGGQLTFSPSSETVIQVTLPIGEKSHENEEPSA
jgi:C4-dicarboxylate-specific signal transduction histidine kinase